MKNKVKELRVKIDGIAQLVKELKPITIYGVGVIPARHFGNHTTEIGYTQQMGNPKEIEKSYDSLILAKAWLGKVLGELGEETPYKNDGKRKNAEDIEKTVDTVAINKFPDPGETSFIIPEWSSWNHIEKVDWLREEIKVLINHILDRKGRVSGIVMTVDRAINDEDYLGKERDKDYNCWFGINQSYKYLQEARFWLGFELQRVKEDE